MNPDNISRGENRERLKIGVLGGGNILAAHSWGFQKVADRCRVAVVAEADPARDEAIRKLVGDDVKITRDYREVLAMPDLAGVDILLPHELHMPVTLEAAAAGKHVLVEKVMARNTWECDQMIAACERAGVCLTICHDRRYEGEWQALKEIIDSGVLGEVFLWKLDHNQNVAVPPSHWAYWRDGIGGGSIMSCLTHQIDGLRWLGGEVDAVTCMKLARPERMQGEFLGMVLAKMKSGALAELSINWWTQADKLENGLWYEMVQVCGTKGEAYRMSGRGTFLHLKEPGEHPLAASLGPDVSKKFVQVPAVQQRGHVGCIEEWVNLLSGLPAKILTTGRECRGTVEVAEAAYLSADAGATVSLPITPTPWKTVGKSMPSPTR